MKVKKLLTLLLVAGAMSACQLNGATNNSGSSDNNPSTQSPSSDSSLPDNSSEDSSADSSVAPTLASIAVTAPTKTAYLTTDAELDLTGMVVTATMSDGSTQAVASGYEVGQVDFSTAGQKDVTVTYQGKSDSFQITVSKPTAWSDDVIAEMTEQLSGYVVPFFYGPDLGTGLLDWDSDTYVVFAYGDEVDATAAADQNALAKVAALLVEDGFQVMSEPNAEQQNYEYYLAKSFADDNQVNHFLIANIAAVNDQDEADAQGDFYLEVNESYFGSWADSGIGAALKAKFNATEDIPDLPAGALISREDYEGYTAKQIANEEQTQVQVYLTADQAYMLAVADALEDADWFVATTRTGYVAYSPEDNYMIQIVWNTNYEEVWLVVSQPAALPAKVVNVAQLIGVNKHAFSQVSSTGYEVALMTELKEGETNLEDVFNRFNGLLSANNAFVRKSDISTGKDRSYGNAPFIQASFFNEDDSIRVDVEVLDLGENGFAYVIDVDDYEAVSADIAAFIQVINGNKYNAYDNSQGNVEIDFDPAPYANYQAALDAYKALIVADAALESPVADFEQKGDVRDYSAEYQYIVADFVGGAEGTTLARIYVFLASVDDNDTPEDETDDIYNFGVEVEFMFYNPAPESAWVDAIAAKLGLTFKWDNKGKCYFDQYATDLTVKSQAEYLNDIITALITPEAGQEEGLAELLFIDNSYAEYGLLEAKLYGVEGYIDIQLYIDDNDTEEDETDDVAEAQIAVYFYKNPELPLFVNSIACAIGVELDAVEDHPGYYMSAVEESSWYSFYIRNNIYALTSCYRYFGSYGELSGLVAATSLGFSMVGKGDTSDKNSIFLRLTNADGWTVEVTMYGDGTNWLGYFRVLVVAPAEGE